LLSFELSNLLPQLLDLLVLSLVGDSVLGAAVRVEHVVERFSHLDRRRPLLRLLTQQPQQQANLELEAFMQVQHLARQIHSLDKGAKGAQLIATRLCSPFLAC